MNERTHLSRLDTEAIEIMREAMSEAVSPVMLYSVGKDGAVMLHLAKKPFFPLLQFHEMYNLRDKAAKDAGMELIVHQNLEAKKREISPFNHGALYTDI